MTTPRIILDTNIVLDLYVFQDPATQALHLALQQKAFCWIASAAMRDELERVLAYPQIAQRLARSHHALANDGAEPAARVLARFDAQARIVPAASKAPVTCRDPDDQKFIDLAVAHQCLLLSKDKAILCMKKRLLALSSYALTAIS